MTATKPVSTPLNFKVIATTRRVLLLTILVGIVAAGLLLFGVLPQLQAVLSLNQSLATEQPKLVRLKQKLIELEGVQFTPEFNQVDIVNDALPSKKPLLEFLTSLHSIATSTRVNVGNFEVSPGSIATQSATVQIQDNKSSGSAPARGSAPRPSVSSMKSEMTVRGLPVQVSEFLNLVEKMTPFTTITNLTVEIFQSPSNPAISEMEAVLITETYFFTQSVQATVEAPLPKISTEEQKVLSDLAAFVANDLPEQQSITGGGVQDLFGVDPLEFE